MHSWLRSYVVCGLRGAEIISTWRCPGDKIDASWSSEASRCLEVVGNGDDLRGDRTRSLHKRRFLTRGEVQQLVFHSHSFQVLVLDQIELAGTLAGQSSHSFQRTAEEQALVGTEITGNTRDGQNKYRSSMRAVAIGSDVKRVFYSSTR